MADSKPDKAQEQAKKDEQKKANMPIVTVCTLDLRQILVALHEKALKQVDGKYKSGELELTIQNSAIEGAGGKDAKFYGAGLHIIAAIPKDAKGLDKNKVQKKDALPALQTYVQWFVGPDLKKGVTDKDLKPLEDGAEGKVEDNHKKKEDIEKSRKDDISGEKYENNDETKKESTIFVPSFSQYLLTEEGEETPKDDSAEGEENKDEKKEDKPEEKKEEAKGPDTAEAQGWYVEYKMTIPGQKEHSILDAMKKLGADLLKAMGVKFTSLFGGADGKVHTIGDLVDGIEAVFGKMDVGEFEPAVNEELKTRMKNTEATARVWDTPTILKYLKKEVAKDKAKIKPVKYALCIKVNKNDPSYKLFNEDAVANVINSAISKTSVGRGLGKRLMRMGIKGKEVILVNNYGANDDEKKKTTDAGAVADSLITVKKPLINESLRKKERQDLLKQVFESCFDLNNVILVSGDEQRHVKVNNELLESMFAEIDESLLLEGHSEEQLNVEKEIDRIGVENLTKNVDELRKNYFDHLNKVKKDNPKNDYVQKILVNSKNWLSKEFIGKLRDQDEADTDTIKKMLKDCVSRVGKTNDVRFELQALVDAMKPLPDGPKDDKEDEDKEDGDKITITFRDVDDPGELSDPESPSDKDKEKYKTVGDPLELVPGEDVKIPEIKNKGEKGEWEFMGFEPDPENMDESGYTYAIYTKNGPDTVKITFYDADPETGDKLKDPLGKPIEIKKGEQINQSDEAQTEFEKYDKQLESDKKEGYIFKGWNPDPSTKVDEDTDVVAKYIEEGEKDTEYTVIFQYAKDQEKPNEVDQIEGDLGELKVKAGEKAERPNIDELKKNDFKDLEEKGYIFKDWGDEEKNLDNVQDNIVAIAQFVKPITITPKAPKDPSAPDKDLEPVGDPIKIKPGEEPEMPEAPKKDGYQFEKWNPDPKNMKESGETIATYKDEKDLSDEEKGNFTIKVVLPDPEDPDNTKTLTELATILVVQHMYKASDLEKFTNDDVKFLQKKNATKMTKDAKDHEYTLKSVIKQNEDEFKKIDNIKDIEKAANDKAKGQDGTEAKYKFKEWKPSIEDAAASTPKKGEDEVVIKAIFTNDMKAKHSSIDFYIVPMKGLKDKDKHKDNTGSK